MQLSPQPWFHPIFEVLGYAIGYALYRREQDREPGPLDDNQRWRMFAAAALGSLAGSRALGLLDQAPRIHFTWSTLVMPGGRTAVGALLGGWIGLVLYTPLRGIYARTGDLFAVPLCLGIAVGRIGCFLSGLPDGTQGRPTALPWGVDFGDGIARHPAPLYEILFLVALAGILQGYQRRPHPDGATVRIFLAAYLAWRLLIDSLKPEPRLAGLSLIQWASVAGLLVLLPGLMRLLPGDPRAIRSDE